MSVLLLLGMSAPNGYAGTFTDIASVMFPHCYDSHVKLWRNHIQNQRRYDEWVTARWSAWPFDNEEG